MTIEKSKQRIHTRRKGKKEYTAGTKMNPDRLLKLLETTIRLVEHYMKKKGKAKK